MKHPLPDLRFLAVKQQSPERPVFMVNPLMGPSKPKTASMLFIDSKEVEGPSKRNFQKFKEKSIDELVGKYFEEPPKIALQLYCKKK